MKFRRLLISILFLLFFTNKLSAQNTVAWQSFEGTAADNWSYTAPTQSATAGQTIVGAGNYGAGYAKTGSNSMRVGGGSTTCGTGSASCVNGAASGAGCTNNANGKIVQFNTMNVECLSGLQISVAHRSHVFCTGQGEGFDSGESLFFEVSLNGGAWTVVGTLGGFSNYAWTYATTPAGSGTTVANPFVYNVPAGTVTVAFRTRCATDRADEVYYIDDVKLSTSTNGYSYPGTAGLWNGNISVDWNNKCNWDNRTIPLTTTDVTIPNGAVNDCEILAGQTGNCNDLVINKQKLMVKYFTSILNVTGDLTIDNNGELDMSLSGNEGGTLNLYGNWLNKRDETYFKEGKSTVNFIGTTNQQVTILADTKEVFYKSAINKPSGNFIANTNLWIDKAIAGGTSTMLTINNGMLDLNGHNITIWNPNYQALQRSGGGIKSELTNNTNSITWKMNSNTGSYIFPFIKTDGTYIPFTFNHTSGNAGDVTIATYGTAADNLPWPISPVNVTNLNSSTGLSPDNRDATVDRFWQVDVTGVATANLTFNYAASELPAAPYNTPASIKAQRFSSATNKWLSYLPGQSAGAYTVTVPAVTSFSTWALTATSSPLPIELLYFNAVAQKEKVHVLWTTITELNNDYFTVERSVDNTHFEEVGKTDGAGNSYTTLDYKFIDGHPYKGTSYYRLKQTDYNGSYTYSKSVKVKMYAETTQLIQYAYNNNGNNIALSLNENNSVIAITVTDVAGGTVFSKTPDAEELKGLILLTSARLSNGLYFVNVSDGTRKESVRVVVYR